MTETTERYWALNDGVVTRHFIDTNGTPIANCIGTLVQNGHLKVERDGRLSERILLFPICQRAFTDYQQARMPAYRRASIWSFQAA
jgi:hypothetical protein